MQRSRPASVAATAALLFYLLLSIAPIGWMVVSSLKPNADAFVIGDARLTGDNYRALAESRGGDRPPTQSYLLNSVIVGGVSTLLAVGLATLSGYAFSRFSMPGKKDALFFILSTRMMPPLTVIIPIFIMYSSLGLTKTYLGLILLYATFNLSLAVWLMKGFMDEIPPAYEEAALVDGYTRLEAFRRIVVPHCLPGVAVTAVFCLISAWNEYAFALILNQDGAVTFPVFISGFAGTTRGVPWSEIAAATLVFVAPVLVFTFLVREHLTRGATFGAVKGR